MKLKILIVKSENIFIAHELTYDLCVAAETAEKALEKLGVCIMAYITTAEPVEINHKVPTDILEKFENAKVKLQVDLSFSE